jgi:hypothetical protein
MAALDVIAKIATGRKVHAAGGTLDVDHRRRRERVIVTIG